jgi:hypothetical protein
MKKTTARVGMILLSLATVSSALRAQVVNNDLKSGKVALHKVLVIPAEASVTKSGMKGNDALVEESRIVENSIPGFLSKALQSRGCTVVDNVLTPDALSKNDELKGAVADVQGRFDKISAHVAQKPKDVRTGRYTMGDEVTNFSPGAAADALVFTRAAGVLTTGGKKTFSALTGTGNAADFIVMNMTVVDSQTGNVLFYTRAVSGGNFIHDTGRMAKPIDKSFKGFSCGAPSGKKK